MKKLRHKVNGYILVTFLLIGIISAAIYIPYQNRRAEFFMDAISVLLHTLVERDKEPLANEIFEGRIRAIDIRLRQMSEVRGLLDIDVFDAEGRWMISSNERGRVGDLDPSALERLALPMKPVHAKWKGKPSLIYMHEIRLIGERIGIVRIYYSLEEIENEKRESMLLFIIMTISTLFIMLISLNIMFSRAIMRPLARLRNTMRDISEGRFGILVDIQQGDEIGELAISFNHMSAALSDLYSRLIEQNLELDELNKTLESRILSQQEAEKAFAVSEKKYRQLYESSRDGYAFTDRYGRFLESNTAFHEMAGYSIEELKSMTPLDLTPHKWHDFERRMIREQALSRGYTDVFEKELIHKDGTVFPVEIRIHMSQNQSGSPFEFWGFVRDITEKRGLREEAIRKARLASIGELAAGVAHEINNPINGIINYIQILIDMTPPGADEAEILKRIMREADRIEGIVSSLLSFARASKKQKCPVLLHDVIEETMCLIASMLRQEAIRIDISAPAHLPPVMANNQQLQQVFLNLISNARHALNSKHFEGDHDKMISIKSELHEADGIPFVQTIVKDNGMGIPSSIIERIGTPFFTTKPHGVGTGLGLSISHGIIEEHGGRLKFHSVEGDHTKAIIDIPAFLE